MQIAAVRAAIADAARTVTLPAGTRKLTATGYTPDSVTEPHFFTGEVAVDFDRTMGRGVDELEITCRVLVGRGDDRAAQAVLDALLSGAGPASLKAAIEAARGAPGEPALGGLAHDLRVERVQGYRWYEHAGVQYVGAELTIRVIGDGRT
ncbi:hypothetical protein [Kitasatospora purpeofusca]|uniref:hypothetical protein n=1 Tax=Kitasatospora purpeofusca TaxID=67352 RepID=UPI00224F22AD|nr:hypothetical protein [Kitasatospora purpeofusca]MCX4752894.1 hypothetical protein [Kitasatospora purpeofusca]WSR32438.1 hypothetical protein OG715_16480 [Kitasatospora purpeofusca]WSR40525.1 hypothetical protein OG196_16260 [Kitasatospora purpeofusca]